VKGKFNTDLQATLDRIPSQDMLIMAGDFNAKVGVLKPDEEEWHEVMG